MSCVPANDPGFMAWENDCDPPKPSAPVEMMSPWFPANNTKFDQVLTSVSPKL